MPKVNLSDLLAAGLIESGESLVFTFKGTPHKATVQPDGAVQLEEDGTLHRSPSSAAVRITGRPMNGWDVWRVSRLGKRLTEVRKQYGS